MTGGPRSFAELTRMKHLCVTVAASLEAHQQIGAHYGLVQHVLLTSQLQELLCESILIEYCISYINANCHSGEIKQNSWMTMLLNKTI